MHAVDSPVFDADNHYYEALDAFTRHLDPKLGPRVIEWVEIMATITLGRPRGHHGPVRRRPLPELVYGERWGEAPEWAVDPAGAAHTSAGPPTPNQ